MDVYIRRIIEKIFSLELHFVTNFDRFSPQIMLFIETIVVIILSGILFVTHFKHEH